ncbi:MAG: acyl-CoA thioesterase [Bacteroidales bacterium]|nr:acyl-CoA thioesterase [Bacteroidales bacterium]MBD5215084.1 acyl-CoA thioesterase [Bacteroidales bacterium]
MSESRIPTAEFDFRHRQPVQLRFNDADMFGHINNTVYLQFFDLAKLEYFKCLMGGRIDWKAFGLVVANINCDFFAPCYLEEQLEVVTAVASLGNKSLVLEQRLVSVPKGTVKAIARTTMVNFSLATGATEPISDDWRSRIAAYEQREF